MVEDNELIARFMGVETFISHWKGNSSRVYRASDLPQYQPFNSGNIMPSLLRYHRSWDWMMPVLDKIGRLRVHYNEEGYDLIELIRVYLLDIDINSIFEPTVEFIKWYNKQE